MAKASRSPILGYNHNVRYHGRIFHVQTEDSGVQSPHLYTHLFYEGTILASKKHDYDAETSEDAVRALMQAQHKAVMKELKQAAYDERIAMFFASRGEPATLTEPETTAPAAGPGASSPKALDLDAIPRPVVPAEAVLIMVTPPGSGDGDRRGAAGARTMATTAPGSPAAGSSEAVPAAVTGGSSSGRRRGLITPGPGVYAVKMGSREHPFVGKRTASGSGTPPPVVTASSPGLPQTSPPERTPAPQVTPPGYGSAAAAATPPPPRPSGRTPAAGSPVAPVVVLKPPRPRPTAPASGVVIQRQVIVGVGGAPPSSAPPGRPARPARPQPFVVAGGLHAPATPPPIGPGQPAAMPSVASGRPPPLPVSARSGPSSAADNPFGDDLVSDKSLDDVILAYLSEDDSGGKGRGKRR